MCLTEVTSPGRMLDIIYVWTQIFGALIYFLYACVGEEKKHIFNLINKDDMGRTANRKNYNVKQGTVRRKMREKY